jgi:hypothetical protein
MKDARQRASSAERRRSALEEPRVMALRRRDLDSERYKERTAQERDYHTLITAPTTVYDADERRVTIVYLVPIEEDCLELVTALRGVPVHTSTRTSGLRSHSRIFGYQPRRGGRFDDRCSSAKLAVEDAEAHALVCAFAPIVARYYQRYGPAVYARHQAKAGRVLPQWTLEGGPFTSGIINRNSQLPYHFDSGNFRGVWSGMLGFKHDATGGHLSVPEYDVAFEIADRSLLLFDGQALLHGVTPFKIAPGGHRLTVVYYSLESMWQCLPFVTGQADPESREHPAFS